MLRLLVRRLPALSRPGKRAVVITYDVLAMSIALWAAFSARLGVLYIPQSRTVIVSSAVAFLAGLAALHQFRVYHIVLRYFDPRTVIRIMAAAAVSAIAWVTFVYAMNAHITVHHITFLVPRSVAFIYWVFAYLLLFLGRFSMALLLAGAGRDTSVPHPDARKVVIYGANSSGISLANSISVSSRYRLVAFVDSDAALQGRVLAGVPVFAPEALERLSISGDLHEVFLAMPKANRTERLNAISQVRGLGIAVKTVPAPEEIASGRFTVSDIRSVDVGDLLRRDPVEPLRELIDEAVEGRCILISGAGGSIGSEICRQVLGSHAAKLVLLDHSEYALYTIHQQLLELADKLPNAARADLVPVIGSVLDEPMLRRIIKDHGIDTIFHAAAYKHVPLLEDNEMAGIENNVFGTLALVRAACRAKITRFTMISTDKAVRPTSVMGASKRVAELVVQAAAAQPKFDRSFGIVRFGNVLDSSGSVIERFRHQIRAGGPITVTHPEMTRYFMSIPEATQLVLQASAMARRGEVFVLDMGEAISITELARHMVDLSGMTVRDDENPSGDIEICYVGLRPGEKLHEELFLGRDLVGTRHPRIQMAQERVTPQDVLDDMLDKLKAALESGDRAAVRARLGEFIEDELHDKESWRAEHRPLRLIV